LLFYFTFALVNLIILFTFYHALWKLSGMVLERWPVGLSLTIKYALIRGFYIR
jgi:hypothetical protein